MDKIDKFLNRRKQKNKKSVKINNTYYDITKQDIKIIRQYKKNKCLDDTVDMYIPYKKSTMKIEFKENKKKQVNEEKQIKKYIKKHDFVKSLPVDQNVITDIWEENDLDTYEQNIVLDISKQYDKNLGELNMDKDMLEKELRRVYLKQYLPRTKNNVKISDLIKKHSSSETFLSPNAVSKWYNLSGDVQYVKSINGLVFKELSICKNDMESGKKEVVEKKNDGNLCSDKIIFENVNSLDYSIYNNDNKICVNNSYEKNNSKIKIARNFNLNNIFVHVKDNIIEFYEIRNFYKFFTINLENKIVKVEINDFINILCEIEKGKRQLFSYKNNELILLDEGQISDFTGNFIIKNKKIKILKNKKIFQDFSAEVKDTYNCSDEQILKEKLDFTENVINLDSFKDNLTKNNSDKKNIDKIKCTKDKIFLLGKNIFRIINLDGTLLNEYKVFGEVIDFVVCGDIIFLINTLKNVVIYDYIKNIIVHSMKQDNNLNSLCYNLAFKLLAVCTDTNILIYHIDIGHKYVLINKIKGKHSNVKFYEGTYWLYGKKKDKYLLYT